MSTIHSNDVDDYVVSLRPTAKERDFYAYVLIVAGTKKHFDRHELKALPPFLVRVFDELLADGVFSQDTSGGRDTFSFTGSHRNFYTKVCDDPHHRDILLGLCLGFDMGWVRGLDHLIKWRDKIRDGLGSGPLMTRWKRDDLMQLPGNGTVLHKVAAGFCDHAKKFDMFGLVPLHDGNDELDCFLVRATHGQLGLPLNSEHSSKSNPTVIIMSDERVIIYSVDDAEKSDWLFTNDYVFAVELPFIIERYREINRR